MNKHLLLLNRTIIFANIFFIKEKTFLISRIFIQTTIVYLRVPRTQLRYLCSHRNIIQNSYLTIGAKFKERINNIFFVNFFWFFFCSYNLVLDPTKRIIELFLSRTTSKFPQKIVFFRKFCQWFSWTI